MVGKSNISRITRTFGTLLSSGVPILQALQITRDIVEWFICKAMAMYMIQSVMVRLWGSNGKRASFSNDGYKYG